MYTFQRNFLFIFLLCVTLAVFSSKIKASEEAHDDSGKFHLNPHLVHHLMDSVLFEWNLGGKKIYEGSSGFANPKFVRRHTFVDSEGKNYRYQGGVPLHITRRSAQMIVTSILLVFLLILAARRIASDPFRISGKFSHIIEVLVQWCRKDIVDQNMHGVSHKGFYSLILTLFFFILSLNLSGLLPPLGEGLEKFTGYIGGSPTSDTASSSPSHKTSIWAALWPGITVTGDLSVTLSLALITALMIWVTGFLYQGFPYLWRAVPSGVPLPLYILLWPLEFVVSPIAKGFALTIRLLANMTAGHVIILALLGFIFQSASLWSGGLGSAVGATGIVFASVSGVVGIYFLEIMVAFLQAFIFTLLTALFIGSSMHRH